MLSMTNNHAKSVVCTLGISYVRYPIIGSTCFKGCRRAYQRRRWRSCIGVCNFEGKRKVYVSAHINKAARGSLRSSLPVFRDSAKHRASSARAISVPPWPPAPCAFAQTHARARSRPHVRLPGFAPPPRVRKASLEECGCEVETRSQLDTTPWMNRRSWRRQSGW